MPKTITITDMVDILGLNLECYTYQDLMSLFSEFEILTMCKGYDPNEVWLAEECGIYTSKIIKDRTQNLIVAQAI